MTSYVYPVTIRKCNAVQHLSLEEVSQARWRKNIGPCSCGSLVQSKTKFKIQCQIFSCLHSLKNMKYMWIEWTVQCTKLMNIQNLQSKKNQKNLIKGQKISAWVFIRHLWSISSCVFNDKQNLSYKLNTTTAAMIYT